MSSDNYPNPSDITTIYVRDDSNANAVELLKAAIERDGLPFKVLEIDSLSAHILTIDPQPPFITFNDDMCGDHCNELIIINGDELDAFEPHQPSKGMKEAVRMFLHQIEGANPSPKLPISLWSSNPAEVDHTIPVIGHESDVFAPYHSRKHLRDLLFAFDPDLSRTEHAFGSRAIEAASHHVSAAGYKPNEIPLGFASHRSSGYCPPPR